MNYVATFLHEPLDTSRAQIRLLSIQCEAEGPIHCSVNRFEMGANATPAYRAVSYTWGPPMPVQQININGHSFTVRQNLYDFLISFRAKQYQIGTSGSSDRNGTMWLWIDQVCIDQASVGERNHQVGMMSSIYATASCVYIWLGTSNKHTELAIKTLELNYQRYNEYKRSLSVRIQSRAERKNGLQHALQLPLDTNCIGALKMFSGNSYWQRLWIVQEVMLAQEIQILCGITFLPWEALKRFGMSGLGYLPSSALGIPAQVTWLAVNALVTKEHDLGDLLKTFSASQCEDPRDKIYGLQGLLVKDQQVKVDYRKSFDEVFFDAALRVCQRSYVLSREGIDQIHRTFNFCRPVDDIYTATIKQIELQLMSVYRLQAEYVASNSSREGLVDFAPDQAVSLTKCIKKALFRKRPQEVKAYGLNNTALKSHFISRAQIPRCEP